MKTPFEGRSRVLDRGIERAKQTVDGTRALTRALRIEDGSWAEEQAPLGSFGRRAIQMIPISKVTRRNMGPQCNDRRGRGCFSRCHSVGYGTEKI
jgi:hypothetical protein